MTPATTATTTLPIHLSAHLLDTRHPAARAETTDCHRLHARIAALFDAIPAPPGSRVLWAQPRPDVLLLQGPVPVHAEHLPPGYTLQATTRPVAIPPPGTPVALSLIGNPSICPVRPGTPEQRHAAPRRRAALSADQRDTWLARKLAPALALHPGTLDGRDLPPATGRGTGGHALHLARRCYCRTSTARTSSSP